MANEIRFFGKSDVGLKRKNNEDTFWFDPDRSYCLVADGMGGAAAGEVASGIFAETAKDLFSAHASRLESEPPGLIQKVFNTANRRMLDHVLTHSDHEGMGCTAELLVFSAEGFNLGHIGDSRTYRFRSGILTQITEDHSFVQDQINQGLLSPEEARKHPLRSVILRAVGVAENPEADIVKGEIQAGDIFLLCSDGLTDMVEESIILTALSSHHDLRQKADRLIESAKSAGGDDNITVVLAEVA